MCKELEHIARSTYYEHKAREREPQRRPRRVQRDEQLSTDIKRVWNENMQVYGVHKGGANCCAKATRWRAVG